MACTTILVGKNASFDGSTMIARNDDCGADHYTEKKYVIVSAQEQPRVYTSVLSHCKVELPDNPMSYSAVPNAVEGKGIWAACGVNEKNVGMTATETITSNERVLGADPLVRLRPAQDGNEEQPGGLGEEDLVTVVLPYIASAREGVLRLGSLLEQYGTYEMNGIAFSDKDEIWWLETIGGHHWIARRLPDDCYAVIPNQLGLDKFDLEDALGEGKEYLCSADLRAFMQENHLDLSLDGVLNPRDAFGSHSDADHVYNTPRAWYALRYLNPRTWVWDGPDPDYTPVSDDLPWCMVPERKITTQDVKDILSSHYQGTPYDPYLRCGDKSESGAYRTIGINRTSFLGLVQIRPYLPEVCRTLQWLAFGSNVFNAMAPFYPMVPKTEAYLSDTAGEVSCDSWYWANRLVGALADASYAGSLIHIERYQLSVQSRVLAVINQTDRKVKDLLAGSGKAADSREQAGAQEAGAEQAGVQEADPVQALLLAANHQTAEILREETQKVLKLVLDEATSVMKNRFSRSDA